MPAHQKPDGQNTPSALLKKLVMKVKPIYLGQTPKANQDKPVVLPKSKSSTEIFKRDVPEIS